MESSLGSGVSDVTYLHLLEHPQGVVLAYLFFK